MIDDRKKRRRLFTKNRKINRTRFRDDDVIEFAEFANMKNCRELIALKFKIDNEIRVRVHLNYLKK